MITSVAQRNVRCDFNREGMIVSVEHDGEDFDENLPNPKVTFISELGEESFGSVTSL